LPEVRPNISAAAPASLTDEAVFDIGKPHIIQPAIGERGR
jgi:hypothetical protein